MSDQNPKDTTKKHVSKKTTVKKVHVPTVQKNSEVSHGAVPMSTESNVVQAVRPTSNNYALAGFIVSLLGIVVPGFVLSALGFVKAKEHGGRGKGLAIAGVVLSVVWTFVWMVVLFALLLFTAQQESKTGDYTTKGSYDGSYTLSIPSNLEVQSDLNDAADMQFADTGDETYLITINEPLSDFEDNLDINGYADLIISSFSGRIDNFDYKTTDFGYSSLATKDYEITGSVDGVKIVYLVRIAKLEDRFVQVITWTLPSKFDDNREVMETIASSLKET